MAEAHGKKFMSRRPPSTVTHDNRLAYSWLYPPSVIYISFITLLDATFTSLTPGTSRLTYGANVSFLMLHVRPIYMKGICYRTPHITYKVRASMNHIPFDLIELRTLENIVSTFLGCTTTQLSKICSSEIFYFEKKKHIICVNA